MLQSLHMEQQPEISRVNLETRMAVLDGLEASLNEREAKYNPKLLAVIKSSLASA